MTALECKGLSKWYGDVIAVNDLTVRVQPGITGLLGPNGAGKTSLMRMGVGLLAPSAGEIEVLGQDPWDNPALLRRIGYVPESDAPWRELSGMRCAVLAARLSGLGPQEAEHAAEKALARVGLSRESGKRVEAYSRGMRQRLKLAIGIQNDPELLILDEPLLGTDPITRRDLVGLIKELAAHGKTVILSTHILPDVEAMTDRILLLNHGRLMAHGAVGEIRDLLERYPRTVRIATPQPRELGKILWDWPTVLSVSAEDAAVVVRTRAPQEFFQGLQGLLVGAELPFTSITALDENVEAIFRYLTEGS